MGGAKLLDGKKIAAKLQDNICDDVLASVRRVTTPQHIPSPKIVAVSVGKNKVSEIYLNSQKNVAEKIGITHEAKIFEDTIQEEVLIKHIRTLNDDDSVNGILIQMPLPEHIKMRKIFDVIDPEKDIEGVHPYNLGRLVLKRNIFIPCTAQAAIELIDSTGADLYGAEAVVIGSGKVVGRPLSLLLMERMATTTVCHIGTFDKKHLAEHVRRAEILIVAVGKAHLIPGDWIREGSIVIDIGINRIGDRIVGDVDFEAAKKCAAYITPVPGGVGPLTVTILMRNVLTAFKRQKGL